MKLLSSNKDLTIIFLTVNKVPKKWAEYQKQVLLEAARDAEIITISKKLLDWGLNIIQKEKPSVSNVYSQVLRGSKLAKTPFIAIAEDDALYPVEHFGRFRPKEDEFAYNFNRWAILTWGEPTYWWSERISNLTMIAPTKLIIKALEERFAKYPDGTPEEGTGELGRFKVENRLGLPHYKSISFYTTIPVINLNHDFALDPWERTHRKRMGYIRAFDIPYWGKATDLVKKFI